MKLFISFLITCVITGAASTLSMLLLFLLNNNQDAMDLFIGYIFTLIAIPGVYFVLFFPIYIFNPMDFQKNDPLINYQKYLYLTLIPAILIAIASYKIIIKEPEYIIILINALFTMQIGFLVFSKTIRKFSPEALLK